MRIQIESNIVRRRGVEIQLDWGVLATVGVLFYSRNSPDPPQTELQDGQRWKMRGGGNGLGKIQPSERY